ncbi:MAG: myo-inositol 2-dehydrogenase / D-chiro-inositol 1-dehydrogenase [Abditibacteriota bacterium]|jgi:myo-inositol 2-dehydrogenase/D-chiro-inositol 1-dehydrogenase|nr:myo-inositol 2-dehydrogenase / D-chiro-inositol 1-dehydrogenase [Abditibacteriota bacterium]
MAQMALFEGRGHSIMALSLLFQSSSVSTLLGSYDSSYAYPGTQMAELNGTRGRIVMEDMVGRYAFHEAGSKIGQR